MYWTLELASKLEDAPWPATKDELIDWSIRSGAPPEVIENLKEIEDEGEMYESIEDIWPDYPTKEDFFDEIAKGYDYIGLSFFHNQVTDAVEMCKAIRQKAPKSKIVLGGFGAQDGILKEYTGGKEGITRFCIPDLTCQHAPVLTLE